MVNWVAIVGDWTERGFYSNGKEDQLKNEGLRAVNSKSTTSSYGPPGSSHRTRPGIQKPQVPCALDSGLRRNDKLLRGNEKLRSPEGEAFAPCLN